MKQYEVAQQIGLSFGPLGKASLREIGFWWCQLLHVGVVCAVLAVVAVWSHRRGLLGQLQRSDYVMTLALLAVMVSSSAILYKPSAEQDLNPFFYLFISFAIGSAICDLLVQICTLSGWRWRLLPSDPDCARQPD